jgi:hypothetical protein
MLRVPSARRGMRQRAGASRGAAPGSLTGPSGAMTTAIGAAHRLPCAARPGVARRNSLRSLRELRSDNRRENEERSALRAPTPGLRCSAPPRSPRSARSDSPVPRPERPRPADACRSGNADAVRTEGRSDDCSAALTSKRRALPANTATLPAKVRVVRRRRARAQPRSAAVPARARSALRTSDSPRFPERSSRSERSEFRGGAGAASITGHPRAAGASTGTTAADGPRLCTHTTKNEPRGTRCRKSAAAN